jgi:hypothetical protein
MNKINTESKIGEEVIISWSKKEIEGVIINITDDFFILEIKDEFIEFPIIGKEMGFSKSYVYEINQPFQTTN